MLKKILGVLFAILAVLTFAGIALAVHPLITDDTGTQGQGKFQLETNYEYDHDSADGVMTNVHQLQTTLTYGVSPTLMRTSTGIYYVDLDADTAGQWFVRFYATGTGKSAIAGPGQAVVERRHFWPAGNWRAGSHRPGYGASTGRVAGERQSGQVCGRQTGRERCERSSFSPGLQAGRLVGSSSDGSSCG